MIEIREMVITDYDAVIKIMSETPGIRVRNADSQESIDKYLTRNPNLSFVAIDNNNIIGCAMCGHDGRRGYLQHVLVLSKYQRRGIATKLVDRCLSQLETLGIYKTHIDVIVENEIAHHYWNNRCWIKRDDIIRYSFNSSKDPNI